MRKYHIQTETIFIRFKEIASLYEKMEVIKPSRNKALNRKHQETYLSDPEKKERHKAVMRKYYQKNKEKLIERAKLRYALVNDMEKRK